MGVPEDSGRRVLCMCVHACVLFCLFVCFVVILCCDFFGTCFVMFCFRDSFVFVVVVVVVCFRGSFLGGVFSAFCFHHSLLVISCLQNDFVRVWQSFTPRLIYHQY